MNDDRSVGSAVRSLAELPAKGHSATWRLSALEACGQERLAYMSMGNVYAVVLVDSIMEHIRQFVESKMPECFTQNGLCLVDFPREDK